MDKKVIIVGGGHNGLVCGCYLAKAGFSVTILERRGIVGGAAVTEAFHPGFRNSTASYTVSLLQQDIIDDLNLYQHGLKIVERGVNNFLPLPDGDALSFSPEPGQARAEIGRFNKNDMANLDRYSKDLESILPLVRWMMKQTPVAMLDSGPGDIFKAFQASRHFGRLDRRARQLLLKLFSRSAAEVLDEYFESPQIKALFGFDAVVGHYESPYAAGTAYVLLHHVVGEVNGKSGVWGHAIGGMGAITGAMAREAESLGVEIVTDAPVASIPLENGRARTVNTSDGRIFTADIVVANVNPKLLFEQLMSPGDVHPEVLEHFAHFVCKSGTFRMNLALSGLPEFASKPSLDQLTGGIILAPDLDYMDRAFQDARATGMSKQPIVEMLIPSLLDDSLAPAGQHVASLFCQHFDPDLGEAWNTRRDEAVTNIIDTVDRFAPGIRPLIIATQAHSPWDLEQKFGLIGGDIFHGRLSLDQLYSARPMLGMGQYRTFVKNLYLCGAGTHPGGGVSGLPGRSAAREIIKQN